MADLPNKGRTPTPGPTPPPGQVSGREAQPGALEPRGPLQGGVSASTEDFEEAFNIVKAINTRSRMDTTAIKKPLNLSNYMSRETSLDLVLKERLLELSFEGKRWYDLVRKALREKTTNNIKFVADKLDSQSSVVKSKMSSIDALFFPIYYEEMRFNDKLVQNPAYDKEDSSIELN